MPAGVGQDPSTAPPSPQGGGAVPSGGAAAAGPETTGTLPPTGGAGAIDKGIPAQGLEAMGREIGRKVVGALHFGRVMFDPYSEEAKAFDTAIRALIKHFKPDGDVAKSGKMPQLNQIGQGQGGPQGGGPPQTAGPMPQPPTGPIPSLAGANV
jgi:hypothetical protein